MQMARDGAILHKSRLFELKQFIMVRPVSETSVRNRIKKRPIFTKYPFEDAKKRKSRYKMGRMKHDPRKYSERPI